jgi:hypothetical protein
MVAEDGGDGWSVVGWNSFPKAWKQLETPASAFDKC